MHPPQKIVAVALGCFAIAACSSSSTGSKSPGTDSPESAALVARTTAARVPLLAQEAFETHIHTQLVVTVNGASMEVPAGIGIDQTAGRIAALHTHDATGVIHVESPVKNARYTLGQFLTVWGTPADAAGRCAFFKAAAPCTLTVTSKGSGTADVDVRLVNNDRLTLTVKSG